MIFGIDENMVIETVAAALEQAGSQASEEQFNKIAQAIENSMPGIVETLVYGMQEHWKAEARSVSTGWGAKYAAAIKAKLVRGILRPIPDRSSKVSKPLFRKIPITMKAKAVSSAATKKKNKFPIKPIEVILVIAIRL